MIPDCWSQKQRTMQDCSKEDTCGQSLTNFIIIDCCLRQNLLKRKKLRVRSLGKTNMRYSVSYRKCEDKTDMLTLSACNLRLMRSRSTKRMVEVGVRCFSLRSLTNFPHSNLWCPHSLLYAHKFQTHEKWGDKERNVMKGETKVDIAPGSRQSNSTQSCKRYSAWEATRTDDSSSRSASPGKQHPRWRCRAPAGRSARHGGRRGAPPGSDLWKARAWWTGHGCSPGRVQARRLLLRQQKKKPPPWRDRASGGDGDHEEPTRVCVTKVQCCAFHKVAYLRIPTVRPQYHPTITTVLHGYW